MTAGNSQFTVMLVGGKIRMDFFGISGVRIARLRSITFDDLIGSPLLVVVTAALRMYSILVVVP